MNKQRQRIGGIDVNLTKLFSCQAKLDDRIVAEKGLQGVDLLDKKILALLTELGELANEYRGFKFWSEDQESRDFVPNPDDVCEACNGNPVFQAGDKITGFCDYCDGVGVHFHNPLLEEYADCLSFILSIGNELGFESTKTLNLHANESVTDAFLDVFESASYFDIDDSPFEYDVLVTRFAELGEQLGFTTDQIEQAYFEKNKINHKRQESGY